MKKKLWTAALLLTAVAVGLGLLGVKTGTYSRLAGYASARYETLAKEQRGRALVACVNKNPNMTLVGYEDEDERLFLYYTFVAIPGQNNDEQMATFGEAYRHLLNCALKMGSWQRVWLVFITLEPVFTVDDQELHYEAHVYYVLTGERSVFEASIASENIVNFITDAVDVQQTLEFELVTFYGLTLLPSQVNGDPALAAERLKQSGK